MEPAGHELWRGGSVYTADKFTARACRLPSRGTYGDTCELCDLTAQTARPARGPRGVPQEKAREKATGPRFPTANTSPPHQPQKLARKRIAVPRATNFACAVARCPYNDVEVDAAQEDVRNRADAPCVLCLSHTAPLKMKMRRSDR
ncbi:hypothetical protein MTO96_004177 [Rhipicephalus appendiculatus]